MTNTDSKHRIRVNLRWMIQRDMKAILDIENLSFVEPWTEQVFLHCFKQRNCICMVAEEADTIAGYMIYELHASHIRLVNLAVHSLWRGYGVGRQMMEKLQSKVATHRRNAIIADVPDTMLKAHLFLRACGFKATQVKRNGAGDGVDLYRFEWRPE